MFLIVSFFIHVFIFALPFGLKESVNQMYAGFITIRNSELKPTYQKQVNKPKIVEHKNIIAEDVKDNNVNLDEGREKENNIEEQSISEYEIGSLEGPKIISRFKPIYPHLLKKRGVEGFVILKLLIDENGKLIEYNVIEKTNEEFLKSVLKEVEKANFEPAKLSGKSVKSYGILKVSFRLED